MLGLPVELSIRCLRQAGGESLATRRSSRVNEDDELILRSGPAEIDHRSPS
jgi:hypothetical protein